ncbi:pyridoxal phosphate-dependent aminotransferase [Ectothiorhodospiraceae bacterium WFHF3C12]|nr:pyridoxal phosphate-dependent aminotransferase [Ectothiorhodospiraceae bacterium WFHF3C12]
MDIELAGRVQRIQPSPTMAITARAAELRSAGEDVIGLAAGEPDFETPEHIKAAATAAIADGETRYTPVDGTSALKRAIARKLDRDQGLRYADAEILVSSGAKHSIFNLVCALVNRGDEVVIPAPYWVSYPDMVRLLDGVPVVVPASQSQGFKITPEQLERALTPRSRLVILNSPGNPSGAVYSADELDALGRVLERHPHVVVLTDDIYEHIVWPPGGFHNILELRPGLSGRTVVVNGVSKGYAMTGWRIGYAAGPAPVIAAMRKVQSQSTSNPCSVSQAAAVAALDGDQECIEPMRRAFQERHDFVVARLNAIAGLHCLPSGGTFYAFPNAEGAIAAMQCKDDTALAERLLDAAGVALVPGSAFGMPGHLRLSYACGMDALADAMNRMERLLGAA